MVINVIIFSVWVCGCVGETMVLLVLTYGMENRHLTPDT